MKLGKPAIGQPGHHLLNAKIMTGECGAKCRLREHVLAPRSLPDQRRLDVAGTIAFQLQVPACTCEHAFAGVIVGATNERHMVGACVQHKIWPCMNRLDQRMNMITDLREFISDMQAPLRRVIETAEAFHVYAGMDEQVPVRQGRAILKNYLRNRVAEVHRRVPRGGCVLLQNLRYSARTEHDQQSGRRRIETTFSTACQR